MKEKSFTYEKLIECGNGVLFGDGNAQLPLPPMLMFDRKLNRLGYGAGYYDKLISTLKRYFDKKCKIILNTTSPVWN